MPERYRNLDDTPNYRGLPQVLRWKLGLGPAWDEDAITLTTADYDYMLRAIALNNYRVHYLPRVMVEVVIPIFSYRPCSAILPPTTPIDPVNVPGSAKIRSAPIEM